MNRREFLQGAVDLGFISLAAIIPAKAVFAGIKPKEKHPKDVLCTTQPMPGKKRKFSDRNLICRSYVIRQEFIGATFQDSVKGFGCDKCLYEEDCLYSGTRNKVKTHKTRTFLPEIWSNKFLTEFVNIGI